MQVDDAKIIDLIPGGATDLCGRGLLDRICIVVSPDDLTVGFRGYPS